VLLLLLNDLLFFGLFLLNRGGLLFSFSGFLGLSLSHSSFVSSDCLLLFAPLLLLLLLLDTALFLFSGDPLLTRYLFFSTLCGPLFAHLFLPFTLSLLLFLLVHLVCLNTSFFSLSDSDSLFISFLLLSSLGKTPFKIFDSLVFRVTFISAQLLVNFNLFEVRVNADAD